MAIRDKVAPPTLNLENPSRASAIDRVAKEAQPRPIEIVLSNSFGFWRHECEHPVPPGRLRARGPDVNYPLPPGEGHPV